MRFQAKLLNAAIGASALSGAAMVPSSNLFASPAPALPAPVETAAIVQLPIVSNAVAIPDDAPTPRAVEAVLRDTNPTPEPRRAAVDGRELDCLTRVMLYEAGAEQQAGQIAVAQVVMNRVRSPRFPDSVCSVIYQRGQFSSIRSFSPARNARWNRVEALAREVLDGEAAPVVSNALYFHAARVSPAYVRSRTRVARIGNHIFYR